MCILCSLVCKQNACVIFVLILTSLQLRDDLSSTALWCCQFSWLKKKIKRGVGGRNKKVQNHVGAIVVGEWLTKATCGFCVFLEALLVALRAASRPRCWPLSSCPAQPSPDAPGTVCSWIHGATPSACSVPSSRHHSGRCRDTKHERGLVLHAEQLCCWRGVASPNPVMWCFRSLRCSANLHQLLVITALLIHLLILDL